MAIQSARAVVFYRPEQSAVDVLTVPRQGQIVLDRPLRGRVNRHKADLLPFTLDPEMHDALTAVQILDPQAAELFATVCRDRAGLRE